MESTSGSGVFQHIPVHTRLGFGGSWNYPLLVLFNYMEENDMHAKCVRHYTSVSPNGEDVVHTLMFYSRFVLRGADITRPSIGRAVEISG